MIGVGDTSKILHAERCRLIMHHSCCPDSAAVHCLTNHNSHTVNDVLRELQLPTSTPLRVQRRPTKIPASPRRRRRFENCSSVRSRPGKFHNPKAGPLSLELSRPTTHVADLDQPKLRNASTVSTFRAFIYAAILRESISGDYWYKQCLIEAEICSVGS